MLKTMFFAFSVVTVLGTTMPDLHRPGCTLVIAERFGGLWAECEHYDCPNECTENLATWPEEALVLYCPCGSWEDEGPNINCFAYYEQSDPPVFGGGTAACEALCTDGCELDTTPEWAYSPACSPCQN